MPAHPLLPSTGRGGEIIERGRHQQSLGQASAESRALSQQTDALQGVVHTESRAQGLQSIECRAL
eukprot:scaffold63996_cov17-Tisochrysis_lutea.AAC.2